MSRILPIIALTLVLITAVLAAFRGAGAWNARTRAHVLAGFVGWFTASTLLWVWARGTDPSGAIILNPFWLVPPLVSILAFFVLYRSWPRIALGALTAWLLNAIALLATAPLDDPFAPSPLTEAIRMTPFFLQYLLPGQ